MTQDTLTQSEPWMTPQERDLYQHLIRAIAKHLEATGVPESALVALRVNDIASTWLLARRLETALAPREGEPAPCPTPAQADAIGKCRERLRNATKELEQYAAKHGTPAPQGLVERMHAAVREIRASGLSTDIFSTIPVDEDRETENQEAENTAPETPENPNRAINIAPETPEKIDAANDCTTDTAVDPNPLNHCAPYAPYDPQTPDNSNPERYTPKTPGTPAPASNAPTGLPQSGRPEERRKTGEGYRERYLTSQKSLHESRTRRGRYAAIDIPRVPTDRLPPQDTG